MKLPNRILVTDPNIVADDDILENQNQRNNFFALPTLSSIIGDDLVDVDVDFGGDSDNLQQLNQTLVGGGDIGEELVESTTEFTLQNLFTFKFWNENTKLCELFSKIFQDLSRDLDPYALTLIVVALVIALGGIIAIGCQCRNWKKTRIIDRKYRKQLKECHYDAERWNDYVLDREKLTKNELLDSKLSPSQEQHHLAPSKIVEKNVGSLLRKDSVPQPPPTPTSAQQQLQLLLLQQHNPNSATFSPVYHHHHHRGVPPQTVDYRPSNFLGPPGMPPPVVGGAYPGDPSLLTKIVPIFRALDSTEFDTREMSFPKKLESTIKKKKPKKSKNINNNFDEMAAQQSGSDKEQRKAAKKLKKKQDKLKSKQSKESNRMKNRSNGKQLLLEDRIPFFQVNPSFATLAKQNANELYEQEQLNEKSGNLVQKSTQYETQTMEMEVTGSEDNDSHADNVSQCSNQTYEKITFFQGMETNMIQNTRTSSNQRKNIELISKAEISDEPRPAPRGRRPLPIQPRSPPTKSSSTLQPSHSSRRQQRPVGTMPPPRMARRLSSKTHRAPNPPIGVTVTTGTDGRRNLIASNKFHKNVSNSNSNGSSGSCSNKLAPAVINKNPLYSDYGEIDDFDERMTIISEHPEQYYNNQKRITRNPLDQSDQKTTMMKFANSVRNLAVTPGAVLSVPPPPPPVEPTKTYLTFTRNPPKPSHRSGTKCN